MSSQIVSVYFMPRDYDIFIFHVAVSGVFLPSVQSNANNIETDIFDP